MPRSLQYMVHTLYRAPFLKDLLERMQLHFADIMTGIGRRTDRAVVLRHHKTLAFAAVFGQVAVAAAQLGELAHFGFQALFFLNYVVITQKRFVLPRVDHVAQRFFTQHVADGVDQLYGQLGMGVGETAVAAFTQAPYQARPAHPPGNRLEYHPAFLRQALQLLPRAFARYTQLLRYHVGTQWPFRF